ncbi:MAG: hypothetical protein R3F56_24770 [Planctomycetota bacterium]
MRNPRLPVLVGTALACMAAGFLPQSQGDTLTVTKRETKLRSQKRLLSAAVADLREGDRLAFNSKDGAWLNVTWSANGSAKTGWLHESDVTAKKDVRLSGQGIREKYTVSEAEAARKGFNPQVEKAYRDENPGLEAAFALVDQIQATSVPDAEIERFLREGRLLKEDGR